MGDSDDKNRVTEEVDDRLDAFFSDDEGLGIDSPSTKAPLASKASKEPDDFIAEEQWDEDISEAPKGNVAEKLGISDLKASILSLDWEITDETMEMLAREVERLQKAWQGDNILISFLSILQSLQKYIKRRKASAKPESISLLRSVYDNLEKVLSNSGMDRESKKQIVMSEVAKFEKFKKGLIDTAQKEPKKAAPRTGKPEAPMPAAAKPSAVPQEMHEAPAAAVLPPADMDEIRSAIAGLAESVREIAQSLAAIRRMMEENLPNLQGN